jgi:hypothetical protein
MLVLCESDCVLTKLPFPNLFFLNFSQRWKGVANLHFIAVFDEYGAVIIVVGDSKQRLFQLVTRDRRLEAQTVDAL